MDGAKILSEIVSIQRILFAGFALYPVTEDETPPPPPTMLMIVYQ